MSRIAAWSSSPPRLQPPMEASPVGAASTRLAPSGRRDAGADLARPRRRPRRCSLDDALRAVPAARAPRGPGRRRRLGERLARDPDRARASPTASSCCSRQRSAGASSCGAGRRRTHASSAAAPRSRRPTGQASRSRRRWRRRRSRPSGACRSCGRAASSCCGSARTPISRQLARVAATLAAEPVESPPGLAVLRQDGPDPAGLPAPPRGRPQAAARVADAVRGRLLPWRS